MLPKIDVPIHYLTLPLSKKEIKFRSFLVKEQKILLMAMENNDRQNIERTIKQILVNCTLSENIDVDKLPVIDVEYYFINLRAKSVGEVVENIYICNNVVEGKTCGNKMDVKFNLSDIEVTNADIDNDIQITDNIIINFKYPEFSIMDRLSKMDSTVDSSFSIIVDSINYIYDGEQYYYAKESTPKELMDFLESLNQEQFSKIEKFFGNLPKIKKDIEIKCSKCGYDHSITLEGLENFFG